MEKNIENWKTEFDEKIANYIRLVEVGQYNDEGKNIGFLPATEVIKSFIQKTLTNHSAHLVEKIEALRKPEDLHDIEWQSLTNEQIKDRRFIRSCMNQALDQAIDIINKRLRHSSQP
jgi:hypothetical protein